MSVSYQELNLDELGFLGRGKSKHRPRNDPILYGGDYPFIQTGDVKAANLHIREYSNTYNDVGLAQSKLWDKGTLLITIAANIAETAILDLKACFPDSIVGFVPDESKVNSYFVKYYIEYIKREMQSISQGTTQDNLSLDKIRTFKLKIPEKKIVDEITDVLLTYDNLIENNNRRIAILEEMAQSLYREWFVKFRYPGYQDCKFKESSLGLIPEGWEVKTASEIFNINIGKTPPRKQPQWFSKDNIGIKWVSIKDMGACKNYVLDTGENLTLESIDKFNIKVIPSNTVIMSFKLTVGKVAITTENMATNEAIAHFNIKDSEGMCKEFIYSYLMNFEFQTLGNTSSIGNAINSQIVKAMPVLLPVQVVINSYKKLVVPVFIKIFKISKINKNLKKQRDLLLPKLISGIIEL